MSIEQIVKKQKDYFNKGHTLDVEFRMLLLKSFKQAIKNSEAEIIDALKKDFNKCAADTYMTEISMVYHEINTMLKNLKRWARPKRVRTQLPNFPAKCKIHSQPYGVTLVMAPWNYPFMLTVVPFVSAVAAGNCVVVKPSNYSANTSEVIDRIIGSVFDKEHATVVLGGRESNTQLLEQRFDYIFFTGGVTVGKIVMQAAAKNLTPLTLELGGKSPCIVDNDCDIRLAARRVAWGKYLNGGQTCVAPDYVLVHKDVHAQFVAELISQIKSQYYVDGKLTEDFAHIITDSHAQRLTEYIDKNKLVFGGTVNGRLIEPTVLDNVEYTDAVMQDEIFGPILPLIVFDNINAEILRLKKLERPLALYYFGKRAAKSVIKKCSFGGGCINDVVMHVASGNMPFGGIGNSGMGRYHGKYSFDTFSHYKGIVYKGKHETPFRYMPHTDKKIKFVKKILK